MAQRTRGRDGESLMADHVSTEKRSEIMRAVKSKDTTPEMAVRKLIFSMGYRYRLHRKSLPGTPDLVFPARKKAIFVHGCFWHGHHCKKGKLPKSRQEYWAPKIRRNRERDAAVLVQLRRLGWSSFRVWQCQLKNTHSIATKIRNFLEK